MNTYKLEIQGFGSPQYVKAAMFKTEGDFVDFYTARKGLTGGVFGVSGEIIYRVKASALLYVELVPEKA